MKIYVKFMRYMYANSQAQYSQIYNISDAFCIKQEQEQLRCQSLILTSYTIISSFLSLYINFFLAYGAHAQNASDREALLITVKYNNKHSFLSVVQITITVIWKLR